MQVNSPIGCHKFFRDCVVQGVVDGDDEKGTVDGKETLTMLLFLTLLTSATSYTPLPYRV